MTDYHPDDPTVKLWKRLLHGTVRGGRGQRKVGPMQAIRREANKKRNQ